jgi:2-polyprenyl-3-methyl-5-hydroxy-6-metoxy-1,4-benzoquinol methylase
MESNQLTSNYRTRIYASYGKNFQDAPETFDRIASRMWGKARLYHLRGWLPQDKSARIVDLACGGGKLLHFFVEQGYQQVEGVDISPDQVALSSQVTSNVTQGNVIEFLEANPGKFDLITGFDIVEHFYKDEALRFLDAAYGALRPGGRLILQTPNAGVPWGMQPRYGDFTHELGFNPNALQRLLRVAGFGNIAARECDPPPFGHSLFSSIRFLLWQPIRLQLMAWNLIETGSTGDRVFTRVFLISGTKAA